MWFSTALRDCRRSRKEGCPSGLSPSYRRCKSTNAASLIFLCPQSTQGSGW